MPIYEYRCDNCAHEFETIQKVSEAPLTTCPACSQNTLRKKISASGFRLKGGGWYETDFKAGSKRNVAGEEKTGKDAGAKASGNGGEKSSGTGDGGAKSDAKSESGKSGGDTKGSGSKSDARSDAKTGNKSGNKSGTSS